MAELKIMIHCPELAAAVEKLADAISGAQDKHDPAPIYTPAPAPSVAPYPGGPTCSAPAAAVPVSDAPAYTLDQISRAGAALVDAGKVEQLLQLLSRYGVQAITQLQPDQYGAVATELRGLGAQI